MKSRRKKFRFLPRFSFPRLLALLLGAGLAVAFLTMSGRPLSLPFSFSSSSSTSFSVPSSATLEVGFSPRGRSLEMILNGIRSAEKSIIVAAYSFTSRPITAALLEAHKRGVSVRVIADAKSNTSRNQHSAVMSLASQGVPVRVNDRYAILHHKFMVFDGRHVQTGSFNYSAAAVDRNAENVLILWNLPEMAEIYTREWQRLWNESKEVTR